MARKFRDLTASMVRLTTLAESKVIRVDDVQAEIERLTHLWGLSNNFSVSNHFNNEMKNSLSNDESELIFNSQSIEQTSHTLLSNYFDVQTLADIDPFDAVQLAYVIEVCIQHKNSKPPSADLSSPSRLDAAPVNAPFT